MDKITKMDKTDKLNQQMSKLQRQFQMMKKHRAEEETFLHSGEFAVMKCVTRHQMRHDESPNLVVISHFLNITQATLTPLVDRLVQKELLIKVPSPKDKRAKLISLTPKGKEYLESNMLQEKQRIHGLLSHIGEEDTAKLIEILEKANRYFQSLDLQNSKQNLEQN